MPYNKQSSVASGFDSALTQLNSSLESRLNLSLYIVTQSLAQELRSEFTSIFSRNLVNR